MLRDVLVVLDVNVKTLDELLAAELKLVHDHVVDERGLVGGGVAERHD